MLQSQTSAAAAKRTPVWEPELKTTRKQGHENNI